MRPDDFELRLLPKEEYPLVLARHERGMDGAWAVEVLRIALDMAKGLQTVECKHAKA